MFDNPGPAISRAEAINHLLLDGHILLGLVEPAPGHLPAKANWVGPPMDGFSGELSSAARGRFRRATRSLAPHRVRSAASRLLTLSRIGSQMERSSPQARLQDNGLIAPQDWLGAVSAADRIGRVPCLFELVAAEVHGPESGRNQPHRRPSNGRPTGCHSDPGNTRLCRRSCHLGARSVFWHGQRWSQLQVKLILSPDRPVCYFCT